MLSVCTCEDVQACTALFVLCKLLTGCRELGRRAGPTPCWPVSPAKGRGCGMWAARCQACQVANGGFLETVSGSLRPKPGRPLFSRGWRVQVQV